MLYGSDVGVFRDVLSRVARQVNSPIEQKQK